MIISEKIKKQLGKELLISIYQNIEISRCNWTDFEIEIFNHRIFGDVFLIKYIHDSEYLFFFWNPNRNHGDYIHFNYIYEYPDQPTPIQSQDTTNVELPAKIKDWANEVHRMYLEKLLWERIISNNFYDVKTGIVIDQNKPDQNEISVILNKIDELEKKLRSDIFDVTNIKLEALQDIVNSLEEIKENLNRGNFTKTDIVETSIGKFMKKMYDKAGDMAYKYVSAQILRELLAIFQHSSNKEIASTVKAIIDITGQ